MIQVTLSYLDDRDNESLTIRHSDRILAEHEAARRGWDGRTQPQSMLALQAHKAARRENKDTTPENFDDFINQLDNIVPVMEEETHPTNGDLEPGPA